jgi:hypothetical protein
MIHAGEVKSVLEDMGIKMTHKENVKFLKKLPVSGKCSVFFSRTPKNVHMQQALTKVYSKPQMEWRLSPLP